MKVNGIDLAKIGNTFTAKIGELFVAVSSNGREKEREWSGYAALPDSTAAIRTRWFSTPEDAAIELNRLLSQMRNALQRMSA